MNRPQPFPSLQGINQKTSNTQRTGFSLVELLVVISIIGILVAITTMVGSAVINNGKRQATLGVIQSLDQALTAYMDSKGSVPPALVEVPYANLPSSIQSAMPGDVSAFYPAIDGRARENTSDELNEVNSVALFIQSASVVPAAQTVFTEMDSKFIQNYSPDEQVLPFLLTAFDAWGNPIRYVHPKFDGIIERDPRTLANAGEPVNIVNPNKPFFVAGALPMDATTRVRMKFIRRNRLVQADYNQVAPQATGLNQQQLSEFSLLPDSDGGLTVGNKPYFYSAGPDGDPSTIEDNIYSNSPQHVDPNVE